MTDVVDAKRADLAGPGIGNYEELDRVLPNDYRSLLNPRQTQEAIFAVKRFIEDGLCQELNLQMVQVPLIVGAESGVNDMLDLRASRPPRPEEATAGRGVAGGAWRGSGCVVRRRELRWHRIVDRGEPSAGNGGHHVSARRSDGQACLGIAGSAHASNRVLVGTNAAAV